jgi:hypothetical protein
MFHTPNLYISEAHGLLIDGLLVAAGNLVNDTTLSNMASTL